MCCNDRNAICRHVDPTGKLLFRGDPRAENSLNGRRHSRPRFARPDDGNAADIASGMSSSPTTSVEPSTRIASATSRSDRTAKRPACQIAKASERSESHSRPINSFKRNGIFQSFHSSFYVDRIDERHCSNVGHVNATTLITSFSVKSRVMFRRSDDQAKPHHGFDTQIETNRPAQEPGESPYVRPIVFVEEVKLS